MAAAFKARGIRAAAVHGEITPAERDDVLRRFRAGEIQV